MLPIILAGTPKPAPRALVPIIRLSSSDRIPEPIAAPVRQQKPHYNRHYDAPGARRLTDSLRMACGPGFGTGELLVRSLKIGSKWKLELLAAFLPPSLEDLEESSFTEPYAFQKIDPVLVSEPDRWHYRVLEVRNSVRAGMQLARDMYPWTSLNWQKFNFDTYHIKAQTLEQVAAVFEFTGVQLPLSEEKPVVESERWQEPVKAEQSGAKSRHYHRQVLDDIDLDQLKRYFKK